MLDKALCICYYISRICSTRASNRPKDAGLQDTNRSCILKTGLAAPNDVSCDECSSDESGCDTYATSSAPQFN